MNSEDIFFSLVTNLVLKFQKSYEYIVKKTTELYFYGWLPLNDINSEGDATWDDNTGRPKLSKSLR